MRPALIPTLFLLATLVVALPVRAADIEGTWLTEKGDAVVDVVRCGDQLCGKVIWMRAAHDENGKIRLDIKNPDETLREREILGIDLLHHLPLTPDDKGVYRGGRVYDPKSGKTYRCYAKLVEQNKLKLRGFIGVSLLGRTTHWTRVDPDGRNEIRSRLAGGP